MTLQLDANALGAIAKLLDKLTDKHESHQDAASMQQIKAFCKQSDENITWFSTALLQRLKEDHAQTRLHVVNIADQLFQRSKAFRNHLTAHFTEFLELSLGFKHDKPLPGPAPVANQLRERTLEIVEQWNDKFGSTYKQVALGFNYLKNNMAMRFPEVRARAAAAEAEQQERQARSQVLLQEKYQQICRGFDAHVTDMKATLTQITHGFHLLEGTAEQSNADLLSQSQSSVQMPDDEIAWETVEEPRPAPAAAAATLDTAEDNAGEEGLSAYAMDTIPEDLLQQAAETAAMAIEEPQGVSVTLQNPDPAVVENLQGLDKVLVNRHLPRLQEWLRVFIKVDVGEVASEARTNLEQRLRSSIDLQNQLKLSHTKLESLSRQLASSPAPEAAPAAAAAAITDAPATAAAAITDAPVKSQIEAAHAQLGQSQTAKVQQSSSSAAEVVQAKSKDTAALMENLFGSDDDDDDINGSKIRSKSPALPNQAEPSPESEKHLQQSTPPTPQLAGTAASTDRQAQLSLGSRPSSSLGNSQNPSRSSSSGQRLVDPTAPKRSISFSNHAARRRQSSLVKQRRNAFDAAADAAIAEAIAQRAAATSGAETSGTHTSGMDQTQAQSSAARTSLTQRSGASAAAPQQSGAQPSKNQPSGTQDSGTRGTPAQAASASVQSVLQNEAAAGSTPEGLHASVTEVEKFKSAQTQDSATKPVQASLKAAVDPQQHMGAASQVLPSDSASQGQGLSASSAQTAQTDTAPEVAPEEAPNVITRPDQAEKAPKLKLGSRLAASMAKLATSRQPESTRPEVAATISASLPTSAKDQNKQSTIPEDIKKALLAKAPVVAHANDLVYWDSNNARALVNARGMEYQNHWGAHDPDVELPSEQLNAFFGTRAEYWTPSAKVNISQGQLQQPQGRLQQPSGAQSQRANDGQAGKGLPGASASQRGSAVGNLRAQRAADRVHNEAVIASTDEQLAQALAADEAQRAVKASSGYGCGSKRKAQPTVRERLAKKLLSGRARGQTLGEVESAADAKFQEVNSNRWQATRFP